MSFWFKWFTNHCILILSEFHPTFLEMGHNFVTFVTVFLIPMSVQIFEEEHNIWFLDKGGALVAVKQPSVPTRHLWYVHLENFFGQVSCLKLLFQFPVALVRLIQQLQFQKKWMCILYVTLDPFSDALWLWLLKKKKEEKKIIANLIWGVFFFPRPLIINSQHPKPPTHPRTSFYCFH